MAARSYQGFKQQYPWADTNSYKGGLSIFSLAQRINLLQELNNSNTSNINILENIVTNVVNNLLSIENPPNSNTLKINNTILLEDISGNTSSISLDSTNLNISTGKNIELDASNYVKSTSAISAPSFLSLNQFDGFPSNNLSLIPLTFLSGGNGASLYQGGCLASNGKIYMIPGIDTDASLVSVPVVVIDPITDTFTTIDRSLISGGWRGGVLATNGKIYCAPIGLNILIIDTNNDTVSSISVPEPIYKTTNLYWGAAYADNKVFFIPFDAYQFLVIDITQNEYLPFYPSGLAPPTPLPPPPTIPASSPWNGQQTSNFWAGAVLGIDGNIYTVPHNQTNSYSILKIDPKTLTYQVAINTTASAGQFFLFAGGVLHPNGLIYMLPRRGISFDKRIYSLGPKGVYNTITALNPSFNLPESSYNTVFYGGILSQNGSIYCIPGSSRVISTINSNGIIENVIDVTSLYPEPINTSYRLWFGGVCAPNGKIYLIPWSTPNIGVIKTGFPTLPPWMLEAYFNKF